MVRAPLTVTIVGALVALLLLPAAAEARTKNLWATVNICDTPKWENWMGIRARMPGDGSHGRVYMRFVAQFKSKSGWRRVKGARTKWLAEGSAHDRYREGGWSFDFNPVDPGANYLMRGRVQFQWRRKKHGKWRVVRRREAYTHAGHPSKKADPKGFSAARCRIRG
jgi:hypothetical protein